MDSEDTKAVRIHDDFNGIYKKVLLRGTKLVGAVLFGDTSESLRLMQMIRDETDISGRELTALLQDNAGGGRASSSVADLPEDAVICGCNGVSKGTICSAIRDKGLSSVEEVKNANIQKDGTYSMVPRMYGGVTNPSELKRIAEVAEKYAVPTVKLTGGQRIDLLGIRKEDVPKIWEELGMPSGYAYGKAIRTVKTCVGADYCRFGTADSMGMGIRMEKRFERLNTPAKVKMAVSGCPRNCAESGIKDLGVVAIDGGWELYAGGNGGVKVRAGDLLATVKTEDEVIEYTEAYLQYYRETGKYGERTSEWVARLGIEHLREAMRDAQRREELCSRMDTALAATQDPWKEIIETPALQKELFGVIEAVGAGRMGGRA